MIDRINAALTDRYRIERELGEGGMATVYLAEDLRHDRRVAIKVLRPELAAVVGAERFLAEIKTTASLQHPHILPLHDSGEADGFLFYVMPYVEGETLRERLDRERQLPVDEAVQIARKVGSALQYAHEQGVVHRDVKPANVLLSRGEPLVADFGIALAVSQAGGGRITETGLSLGTPHYMSPEQASGEQTVDRQTDVYALGCVLYEMLVGEPPYAARTAQAVLAKILTTEPQRASLVRRTVPPHVDGAVARALEKLPADRFASAEDFRAALEDPSFRYVSVGSDAGTALGREPAPSASAPAGRERTAWIAVAAALALLAAWGWLRAGADTGENPPVRLSLDLGELESIEGDVVVSPDGRRLAVSAVVEGERAIWTRALDELTFTAIPGTEDGFAPTFSPDGEWVVFRNSREGTLVKAAVSGGGTITLVDDPSLDPFFSDWGDAGDIVFTTPTGLHLISETGTNLRPVRSFTAPGRGRFLPGGRALVAWSFPDFQIRYVDLEADTSWVVVANATHPLYSPTGHLLYVPPSGGLFALPFDPEHGRHTGEALRVLNRVATASVPRSGYHLSESGTLVYLQGEMGGGPRSDMLFLLLDRGGAADTLRLPPQALGRPRFSPDGASIAYESGGNPTHISIFDLTTGRTSRLTSKGDNDSPVWSPDGTRIVLNSLRQGTDGEDLFTLSASGEEEPTLLFSLPGQVDPTTWSEGDVIGFERVLPGSVENEDLWTVSLSDDGEPRPWLEAPWSERELQISPDEAFAVYESDETGLPQVYVRTFPDPADKWRVSGPGNPALAPRWSAAGDALFFWSLPEGGPPILHEARIERDGDDLRIHPAEPILQPPTRETDPRHWDVHPDGDRFLVRVVPERTSGDGEGGRAEAVPEARYIVILNWFAELRELLGEGGG